MKRKLKISYVPSVYDSPEMEWLEYEIMWEDETNWILWGETEDWWDTFKFPKKVTISTWRIVKESDPLSN